MCELTARQSWKILYRKIRIARREADEALTDIKSVVELQRSVTHDH